MPDDEDIMQFIIDHIDELTDAMDNNAMLTGMAETHEAFERNPLLHICVTTAYPSPQAFLN